MFRFVHRGFSDDEDNENEYMNESADGFYCCEFT